MARNCGFQRGASFAASISTRCKCLLRCFDSGPRCVFPADSRCAAHRPAITHHPAQRPEALRFDNLQHPGQRRHFAHAANRQQQFHAFRNSGWLSSARSNWRCKESNISRLPRVIVSSSITDSGVSLRLSRCE